MEGEEAVDLRGMRGGWCWVEAERTRVMASAQMWGMDGGGVTPHQDIRRSRESCFILEQGTLSKHWRRSRCQETKCNLLRTRFMCNARFCGNSDSGDSRGCCMSGGRTRRKKSAQQIIK